MTIETAREISSNPELIKRLTKYPVQQCFRNTMLEDLHAGISRRPATIPTWSSGRPTARFTGQDFRG